jgi:hypothetical protein
VERGRHEQLLKQNGLYRQIYDLELRAQEEAFERSVAAQGGAGNDGSDGFDERAAALPGGPV